MRSSLVLLLILTFTVFSFNACNKKAADKSQTSTQQKSGEERRATMAEDSKQVDPKSNLPGYTPTGNPEVDEQNYSQAKENLYNNDPEGYRAWVESMNAGNPAANQTVPATQSTAQPATPQTSQIQEIPYSEYIQMPQAKRDHIDAHPELYKVVK